MQRLASGPGQPPALEWQGQALGPPRRQPPLSLGCLMGSLRSSPNSFRSWSLARPIITTFLFLFFLNKLNYLFLFLFWLNSFDLALVYNVYGIIMACPSELALESLLDLTLYSQVLFFNPFLWASERLLPLRLLM